MTQEPEIKRWTAKRKAERIRQICRGQTTVPEPARHYDLARQEIEKLMNDAEARTKNALKSNLKDIAEQYEARLRELREADNEAMPKGRVGVAGVTGRGNRRLARGLQQGSISLLPRR